MDSDDFFNGEYKRLIEMENRAFYTLAVEDGIEIGRAKGREEMIEKMLEALLQDGLSIERVARVSKLPIEKITEIAQRLKL